MQMHIIKSEAFLQLGLVRPYLGILELASRFQTRYDDS